MKKNYLILAIATLSVSSAFAGGLMTNTNQSVHFLRNPALDASTEIDAVYANPAGLTFLSDGFHVSLSNQSAFQTRTITSTFAPFAYNGGSATKEYVGETAAPIIPSVQFAYKKDKLALSGSFAVTGGGGKAVFDNGLPSFEASISMLPASVSTMGVPTTAYSVDGYMEGSQYTFGVQLNGSYLFTEALSGALGVRLNMVNNAYVGHLTDIMINPNHPLINPTAAMMSASAFFTAAGSATYASATADKYLDCTQSGFGVTPIVSLHYRLDELNLAAKYEFKTVMDITNNTTVDNTGMYADGATTPNDIPAYLSVGAEYSLCDKWKVSGGYHHFFDSDARMANDKQQYINGGINEYLLGSEYQLNDMFLVSAGAQITRTGVTDAYQSDLSFSLNSYSIGFGGAVNFSPDLRLNLAYFMTNYSDWTKASADYNSTTLAGTDVYSRVSKVFGIGLEYKF
jgi:long-chain fatty acid transport protein